MLTILSPEWHGFIDADETQLVYFEGMLVTAVAQIPGRERRELFLN